MGGILGVLGGLSGIGEQAHQENLLNYKNKVRAAEALSDFLGEVAKTADPRMVPHILQARYDVGANPDKVHDISGKLKGVLFKRIADDEKEKEKNAPQVIRKAESDISSSPA